MKRNWNNTYESYEIREITIDHSINTLPQLNDDIVKEYREVMSDYGKDDWQDEWLEYPKVTVDKHLWSGFHTIAAARLEFGDDHEVEFEVEGKTRDDALLLATKENAKRGRKRTNEEKRIAVLRWLQHPKGKIWANSHIATQCNVSSQLVGEILKNLTINNESEIYDAKYKRPSQLKYINKYGKQALMETQSIGSNGTRVRQLDDDTRQRYLDDFVEKILQQTHISYGFLTTEKENEIEKLSATIATELKVLSELGLQEKYEMSEVEVNDFVQSGRTAAVVSVRKMRGELFNKSEEMWQKALEADFYKFDNYTQLIESLDYYRNNEDERDVVFAVLSQTPIADAKKRMAGFPVTRFRYWIDKIQYWKRNLASLFEPNEQGCKWFLSRHLYEEGSLRDLDINETAAAYNLTGDKVRSLIISVEIETREELVEIIQNRFMSIIEDTDYITKAFKKLKASDDAETLQAAAATVIQNADVVEKVARLISSVEKYVQSE